MKLIFDIALNKSIDSFSKIVKQLGNMDKRKHDKVLRFFDELLVKFVIAFIICCAAFGYFILGNKQW